MIGKFNKSEIFKNKFEQHCFLLIITAYHFVREKKLISLELDEPDITQILKRKIKSNPKKNEWNSRLAGIENSNFDCQRFRSKSK